MARTTEYEARAYDETVTNEELREGAKRFPAPVEWLDEPCAAGTDKQSLPSHGEKEGRSGSSPETERF